MESPPQKPSSFTAIAQNFGRLLETSSIPSMETKLIPPDFPLVSQIGEEALKPIFPAYQDLSDAVNGLNTKIGSIIRRQNEDYLQEYRSEMVDVQKELGEMRKKYEDFMTRHNGVEQIDELKKQINSYKEAAIRLDETLVKKDKHIQVLKNKINFLEEERRFLNDYITNAVRKNKLISIERHTKPPKDSQCYPRAPRGSVDNRPTIEKSKTADMEDDKNDIFKLSKISPEVYNQDVVNLQFETGIAQVDEFLNELKNKDFGDKARVLKDLESFCKNLAVTFERRFQESRKKIMKEKVKLDGLVNSKLVAKTELAEIFEDCVKRVKLNIEKRRLDGLKLGREGNELAEKKALEAMKSIKIEHKDFLSQDKEKLLEFFVFDETVLNVIKYLISGPSQGISSKASPRDRAARHHNRSVEPHENALNMAEISEIPSDVKGIREKRKNSYQPIRPGNLQALSFNLPQISESQRDGTMSEHAKDDKRVTSLKMEQLIGYQSHVRKDVTRNYKM